MKLPTLNAGVRLRIGLLGLLGVVGVLVLGGINLYGANRQATYQASADQAVELRLLSVDLGDAVLEARRAEIEFLLKPNDQVIAAREQLVKRVDQRIAELDTTVARLGDADLAGVLKATRANAGAYLGEFASVVAMQRNLGFDEN